LAVNLTRPVLPLRPVKATKAIADAKRTGDPRRSDLPTNMADQ